MAEISRLRTRRAWGAATAVGSIALTGTLGAYLFLGLGLGPYATFALMAGLLAALSCGRIGDAAVSAPLGVVAGTLLAQATAASPWPVESGWPLKMALSALIAAVVGAAAAALIGNGRRLSGPLTALALALLVAAGMSHGIQSAAVPSPADWATSNPGTMLPLTRALLQEPRQTDESVDDTIHLLLVRRLARGEAYYPAAVAVLAESNRVHTDGQVRLDSASSFRTPYFYWLLSRLALSSGAAIVMAALVLTAAAGVFAFLLSRRFVPVAPAFVGATAVIGYGSGLSATPGVLYSELWVGLVGLIAASLFVVSQGRHRHTLALQATAAVCALAAALMRELALPFVVAGWIAAVADPTLRRKRTWIAWALAFAVAAIAYATHWTLSASAFAASGAPAGIEAGASAFPWFHPDGSGLRGAVLMIQIALRVGVFAGVAALATGAAGSLAVPAERGGRVMLGLCAFVGPSLLVVVRAAGTTASGAPLGYWGMVVIPCVFACIPLVFARVPAVAVMKAGPPHDRDDPALGGV